MKSQTSLAARNCRLQEWSKMVHSWSIVEVVEKFVKMWYNTFACERQIVVCGGVWMCGIATDL